MIFQFEKKTAKSTFAFFIVLFVSVNLLQAFFTSLFSDEAYYALWGQHLDWGYFDHPPMVAIYNYLSSILFSGNLGVRFVTVVSHSVAVFIVWKTIDSKESSNENVTLFFIIAASLVMFQALGFITTPDAPLLLFIAIFLYLYKRFLREETWLTAALLCLTMAGLVYSKYQSVLLIGFIILSNLRLLRNIKFWLAGIFAIVLLLPHFYWQFSHNFPSIQFHLVDRADPFDIMYILEYLPNQLVVFNPVTLGLLVYVLFKYRSKDLFERGLYFTIIGFIAFFWLMSTRGHVEPHWTVACSIPMIIVLYNKALEHAQIRRFIFRYVLASVILVLILRVLLLVPVISKRVFQYNSSLYEAIHSIAGDAPVVFGGSFQDPSLYSFITHKDAFVISSRNSRATQFDVWQWDKKFEGKPVFMCAWIPGLSQRYTINGQTFDGYFTNSFHSAVRLDISVKPLSKTVWHIGDTIRASFIMKNPTSFTVNFKDKFLPVTLCAYYCSILHEGNYPVFLSHEIDTIKSGESIEGQFYTIVSEVPEGEYQFGLSVNDVYGPSIETGIVKIKIEK